MTAPEDLDAWLRLLRTPGIGRASARRLLASCGSPQAVFGARPVTLSELVGAAVFSYEEAAEISGCAVGTIKSRVNRARNRLGEMLGMDETGTDEPGVKSA